MPQNKKELTDEEIKEAVEKRRCPYCKAEDFRLFVGDFPSWQKFEFVPLGLDKNGVPEFQIKWQDPDTSADFEQIECVNCEEEIPQIIWRKWGL